MHSFGSLVVAGLLGVAVTGLSAPAAGSVDRTSAAAGAVCGTDRASGLGVWAGPATSCPTALEVASGYTGLARHAGGSVVTVRAGGTAWTCREQQGDPNPFLKCVDTAGSRQWVVLTS